MLAVCFLSLLLVAKDCSSQDETGPYRGKYIGKLNSYHHQVSGEVYAVDDWTILLVDFNYDGTGDDTFFWAGDSGRPGPLGFIVPDQNGKTNILERYNNEEVTLKLPEGKRVARVTWLAVYDLASQNTFGDVYVPEEFEAPAPRALTPLVPAPGAPVASGPVRVLDAATLLLPALTHSGAGEVYFWAGVGPQPSARGVRVPDEDGYLEPLRAYAAEDVRLQLPGARTVFDVDWLALWDAGERRALAAVLLPAGLNVPPATRRAHPHRAALPRCRQLHRDLQLAWEVFGGQVTLQLAALMGETEYAAVGVSGSRSRSAMVGADVAVARWDGAARRGLAVDYNVSALAPCVQVLGRWRGVCRDDVLGGLDSNQVFSGSRDDGLTVISWRRDLKPAEEMDLEWPTDRSVFIVWAVGAVDHALEPAYHRLRPAADVQLVLAGAADRDDCEPFAAPSSAPAAAPPPPWDTARLADPALRVFRLTLGPAGGARGLAGRGRPPPPRAWYVNGQLAPELTVRRGLAYTFLVSGGDDPHSPDHYHPLVITSEPHGGLERLGDAAQRAAAAAVLAGARASRRGRLAPAAAGALCEGVLAAGDARRDRWDSFRTFNRSLRWECAGEPARLTVTPNSSWPDRVYYNSFTHADMGGVIYVVDKHRRGGAARAAAAPRAPPPAALALLWAAAGAALRRAA